MENNDIKISTYLMFMLDLNETIVQLAMANSVRWYGHVLRREDGLILRRALNFEIEGEWNKGRPKKTWKKQVEEETENWFENGRCTLLIKMECWIKSDCCWVEVTLAILTCWGFYQILNIGVSLPLRMIYDNIYIYFKQ